MKLGPVLKIMFYSFELFFPNKGGVSSNLFTPRVRDNVTKSILMDPQGTKPKGDGAQVFVNGEIKEDRLVVEDTIGKDFGRAM